MHAKKYSGLKVIASLAAFFMLIGAGIGGTLAWLLDTTDPVTNTFTVGKVDINLEEHSYDPDDQNKVTTTVENENDYPLIPGTSYGKDPKVTVTADSEDCYLFIRIQEIYNPGSYLDYEYNWDLGTDEQKDDWTLVEDNQNGDMVYYRIVPKGAGASGWNLLKGDTTHTSGVVTVKSEVINYGATAGAGEINMPADNEKPQIIFTAFAVQQANRTVEEAWALVDPTPVTPNP